LDQLLTEIQSGVKLRPTKTNDRSKPILDGLRKFRRQMTIEEQIMKSESKAMLAENPTVAPIEDDEGDELDDIDKVRDDLQSTKQMLALELRNKEAQERENKRLLSKIANLEAELEREKQRLASGGAPTSVSSSNGSADDVVVKSLKKEAEEAQKQSKVLEKKYHDTAEQLDSAQKEIEEQKRLIANLEKKLQVMKALENNLLETLIVFEALKHLIILIFALNCSAFLS
jgi:chromosome segregation ATPase